MPNLNKSTMGHQQVQSITTSDTQHEQTDVQPRMSVEEAFDTAMNVFLYSKPATQQNVKMISDVQRDMSRMVEEVSATMDKNRIQLDLLEKETGKLEKQIQQANEVLDVLHLVHASWKNV